MATNLQVLRIDAEIAVAVDALPPGFQGDPADRPIVSTAKAHGLTPITADAAIPVF